MSAGTLLIRVMGPMQSWGTQSRFRHRDTGLEPSKSGIIGLVCCALGRKRSENVDDLAALRMGVRVDREGIVLSDYQTVGGGSWNGKKYGYYTADGQLKTSETYRDYLSDADFLVGLEGDFELLRRIHQALKTPVWQPYLGRKSFVPSAPLYLRDGLRPDEPLEAALTSYPWPGIEWKVPPEARRPKSLRLVLETDHANSEAVRMDQPRGAAFEKRSFVARFVRTVFVDLGSTIPIREESNVSV